MKLRRDRAILLVLDDCGPADALCVDFALEAVLKAHPGSAVDLLVSERAAPVFEGDRRFRSIHISRIYESRSPRYALLAAKKTARALVTALRLGRRYDLAITFYWGTTVLNLVARWASRGSSIGYQNRFGRLVDVELGRYVQSGDPVQQAVRLLAASGIEARPAVARPRAAPEPGPSATATKIPDLIPGGPFAVVHVGSDWACQEWLPERWAEVADRLIDELKVRVVFTGIQAESKPIDAIRSRMNRPAASLAGMTSVADLGAVLAASELCICVDSLVYELAQSAGVPTVVLAGQSRTQPSIPLPAAPIVVNRTTPELRAAILDCKLSIAKASYGGCHHYGCPMAGLRDITVDDVLKAARLSWLDRARIAGVSRGGAA